MPRPTRRHARKASATTAEEILLPSELMSGLTASLSPPNSASVRETSKYMAGDAAMETDTANNSADNVTNDTKAPLALPAPGLELAPLFSFAGTGFQADEDRGVTSPDPEDNSEHIATATTAPPAPEKGILKEPKQEDGGSSRWSLWPGAKKWFTGAIMQNARSDHPTFAQGAGIPAARPSSDEAAESSRTAPSLDFERTTNIVPPLSQERIKSTEFWTNFALELDPSRLKRIRFSMPLIVTEFDPDTSRVCDSEDSLVTSLETKSDALGGGLGDEMRAAESASTRGEYPAKDGETEGSEDAEDSLHSDEGMHNDNTKDDETNKPVQLRFDGTSASEVDTDTDKEGRHIVDDAVGRQKPLQWDVEALSRREYGAQEVRELYERSCQALEMEPLTAFSKTLVRHARDARQLGSVNMAGSVLHGAQMRSFAEMLDLNIGLVRLELSHCGIDDDAARVLAYSLLCNDSVRYLSLANNARVRSDGVRSVAILVRHSKQLQFLDMSGVAIRKKSAGYLAAALTGLGANWSLKRGSMQRKSSSCEPISLQALHMNNCAIKPDTLAILASGVRLSPLQHLALRLNSLGAAAGPILREMLYGDPPQQSRERPAPHPRRPISVSLHGLSDAQIVGGGSGGPGDTPRVSQLRSLDLSQNDLGRAALDLAEGLLWNTNLRSLTLRENRLQPASFAPFIECLGINRGLAHLDISRNPVCGPNPVVLEVLSKVVSQNQTLRGLFMSATGMNSEGAIILAECLPEQQRLERLDVSENAGIDMAGLMALSASIKLNRSLICVEITVNTGDDVCAALEQGIAQVCIANMQRLDTSAHSRVEDYEPDLPAAHVWTHADSSDDENGDLDNQAKQSTEIRPSADRRPSTDSRTSGDSSCSNCSASNAENAAASGSTASLACGEIGCK
ncbi:hypothetical protein H4S08_004026 [Coemansia sp. RSA 1365]|nr:hypothetical protein H4S08_004026 [Coemansia sp. RSA 1365]